MKWPKITRVEVNISEFDCYTLGGKRRVKGVLYDNGGGVCFREISQSPAMLDLLGEHEINNG